MRLWAISDLHLSQEINRAALADVPDHGDDWLILAGDIAEREEHLALAFETLGARFGRLIWVPGNHELWSVRRPDEMPLRGVTRYLRLIDLARAHGVLTPEDPFPVWPGAPGGDLVIAPLFLLYDYSFRPDDVALADVRAWARAARASCADELYLFPDPYPSRQAWCAARLYEAVCRLSALPPSARTILINHWPLRRDLVDLPRNPRFAPWCGTRATEDWHRRFRAEAVISGHLHIRRTDHIDGTRFEEVSLGHPRQWRQARGIAGYLRQVFPAPSAVAADAGVAAGD